MITHNLSKHYVCAIRMIDWQEYSEHFFLASNYELKIMLQQINEYWDISRGGGVIMLLQSYSNK